MFLCIDFLCMGFHTRTTHSCRALTLALARLSCLTTTYITDEFTVLCGRTRDSVNVGSKTFVRQPARSLAVLFINTSLYSTVIKYSVEDCKRGELCARLMSVPSLGGRTCRQV